MDIPLLIALGNTLTHEQMNTPIRENYYPIHEACRIGNLEAVKQMVPHVDTNILSPVGTPIMIAAKQNRIDMIVLLLKKINKEIVFVKDETGKTWLHYLAMHSLRQDTQKFLITWSIYLHKKDSFHDTSPLDIIKSNYVPTKEYSDFIHAIIKKMYPVYYFGGHGCDSGYERIVPKGCIYVTLALCGNNTTAFYIRNFFSILPSLLEDPIKNKRTIEEILGMPIQIYTEGNTYSNVVYTTPLEWCNTPVTINGIKKIMSKSFTSGLQKVYFMDKSENSCNEPELKQKIFKYSILPKMEDLPGTEIEQWTKHFTQSDLFDKYPGIHYNISCRSPCFLSNSDERVGLRRAKSIKLREDQKMVITLEQLRELYPIEESKEESKEEETLQESKEDVLDNRKRLLEYIDNPHLYLKGPKETILSELSSIFPEKELHMLHSRIIGGKRKTKKNKKTRRRKR